MKNSKKLSIIVILVFTFFVGLLPANAEEVTYLYTGVLGNVAVNSETNIASKYNIGSIPRGGKFRIIEKKVSGGGCGGVWYKINYHGTIGYVCNSRNVTSFTVSSINCTYCNNFPETYKPYIAYLSTIYPNAEFTAIDTGINWEQFLNMQMYSEYHNLINIDSTDDRKDGWKFLDPKTNGYLNGSSDGKNYFSPSREAIAYYLDPRNFLNQRYVFMFEKLDKTYDNPALEKILEGTELSITTIKDEKGTTNITYATAFAKIGKDLGVSPYHLATRVIQELGKTTEVISGTVEGRGETNFYNYFNINATGTTPGENKINALKYAAHMGWDSKYKALKGGAEFIKSKYIDLKQNTLYSQKFNYENSANNQYMQNLQAPLTEANQIYIHRHNKGEEYEFLIPVYKDMPDEVLSPNSNVVSSTPTPTPTPPPAPVIKYGDVNSDGKITVLDLLYVQRYLLRTMTLNSQQLKAADVSKDGVVNVLDLLMIQKHLLGISFIR